MVILFVACDAKKENGLYTIGIVQITEDPLLDEARTGVIDSLKEEGFIEGKNIRINYNWWLSQESKSGMMDTYMDTREKKGAGQSVQPLDFLGGSDGTRTRGLRRDRPAL
jgi:hypothetical protein